MGSPRSLSPSPPKCPPKTEPHATAYYFNAPSVAPAPTVPTKLGLEMAEYLLNIYC